MKKAFITIFITSLAWNAIACDPGSDLQLTVSGNRFFTVTFDQQYFAKPDRFFAIENVRPGSHYLEVFAFRFHAPPERIFSGFISLAATTVTHARIDRYGNFRILNIFPKAPLMPVHACVPEILPMSNDEFNMLMHTVRTKNFESTRLEVIRQALEYGYFSTRQVCDLMSLMCFESGKLEVAKMAYNRTLDKEKYFLVNDQFSFDSSIHELNQFIRSRT